MPHSKGQLANAYFMQGRIGFVCCATGIQKLYSNKKTSEKARILHFKVCSICRNADIDNDNFCNVKDILKEMAKDNRFGVSTIRDGQLNSTRK